jgi:AcrR family transcriptional regulator
VAPRAGLDHETVVQVAAALVDAGSSAPLTLAAVADRLGVRVPSLYNHIGSLHSLQRDVALQGSRDLARALTQAVIGRSRDEAVFALAAAYRAYVAAHCGVYELLVRTVWANHEPDPPLDAVSAELLGIALAVLAGYGLDGEEALHAVRSLRSVLHGFASLEALGNFGLPLSVDESFNHLLRCFVLTLQ